MFEELILSSGGIKGVALCGALSQFNLYTVRYYTGTSAGAFLCFLIVIGFQMDEIKQIIFTMDFSQFQELKIRNLLSFHGLDDGSKMANLLRALMQTKNVPPEITFRELYEKTGLVLTMVVTNSTKGRAEYHNYMTMPNMSVCLSLRMSMCIPIVFAPISFGGDFYVDGALLDPFPFLYHRHVKRKIGIYLYQMNEFQFQSMTSTLPPFTDSISYVLNLLNILYLNYLKRGSHRIFKKYRKDILSLYIEDRLITSNLYFSLTGGAKEDMYKKGKQKARRFFKKREAMCRKKYLLTKYFFLWKGLVIK